MQLMTKRLFMRQDEIEPFVFFLDKAYDEQTNHNKQKRSMLDSFSSWHTNGLSTKAKKVSNCDLKKLFYQYYGEKFTSSKYS